MNCFCFKYVSCIGAITLFDTRIIKTSTDSITPIEIKMLFCTKDALESNSRWQFKNSIKFPTFVSTFKNL